MLYLAWLDTGDMKVWDYRDANQPIHSNVLSLCGVTPLPRPPRIFSKLLPHVFTRELCSQHVSA